MHHRSMPIRFKWVFPSAALSCFLALFASSSLGQVSTASVRGTIRDSQGAVVPKASLTLLNTETNVTSRTLSGDNGDYLFVDVPAGQYTLEASSPGLANQRLRPFVLQVNQTTTLDFNLALGSTQQIIEVQAQGEALQSATAELGSVVTTKQVVDLPLNGRNFTNLLVTVPGVAPVIPSGSQVGSYTRSIGTFVIPSINGQTNRSNLFVVDGVMDSETFGNAYAIPPILDAIAEFKAQAHNDSAEFGGSTGGTINIVTKSGTNDLHGDGWEFIKNNDFNARNTFQPTVGVFRQNQFGAVLGGPVWIPKLYNGRNRTFFLFGYEGFRYTQASSQYFLVPTAAQYAGNFAGSNQIYDPASTVFNPATNSYTRTPFCWKSDSCSKAERRCNLLRAAYLARRHKLRRFQTTTLMTRLHLQLIRTSIMDAWMKS